VYSGQIRIALGVRDRRDATQSDRYLDGGGGMPVSSVFQAGGTLGYATAPRRLWISRGDGNAEAGGALGAVPPVAQNQAGGQDSGGMRHGRIPPRGWLFGNRCV